ncbi:hypothetical protein RZE82_07340 [Mollicutes bacterium LVI A0039]|nr:hypothetical protein RZE82_07340 [Mollicutes bacterium LVI A0039]
MKEFDKLIYVQYVAWCSVAITYLVASTGYLFIIFTYLLALGLGFMRYNKPNKTSEMFYERPFKYWRNQIVFSVVFLCVSVPLVLFQDTYNLYILAAMLVVDVVLIGAAVNQIKVVKNLALFKA